MRAWCWMLLWTLCTLASTAQAQEAELVVNQRKVVSLRATLKGETPRERVQAAEAALAAALAVPVPADRVERQALAGETPAVRLRVNDVVVLHLVPEDLAGPQAGNLLDAAGTDAERRLRVAVAELREARDPRHWARGLAVSVLATVVAVVLLKALAALRRRLLRRAARRLSDVSSPGTGLPWWRVPGEHALALLRGVAGLASWVVALVVLDLWASTVLRQFAPTRAWGERASDWLLTQALALARSALSAVPGLLTAGLIFLVAQGVLRVARGVLERVEQGEFTLAGLDADTAGPTRRLVALVVWLFALAMAYPYLPGAST